MNRTDTLKVMRALNIQPAGDNGDWINSTCPYAPWYHRNGTDNSPSFGIKVGGHEPSAFSCQGCHKSGTLTFLVQNLGQLRGRLDHQLLHATRMAELGAALTTEFAPFDRPYEDPEPILIPLNEAIYEGLWPAAWDAPEGRRYLQSRNIEEDTSRALGLLYRHSYSRKNRNDAGTHDWVRGDILFPVRDREGNLYGWSGRTTVGAKPKVFDESLPKRHLILGEHRWRQGFPKLIVEGLFGYAHLVNIGAEEFMDVGALMGSTMTDEKAAILKSWGDATILLVDNDEAGDACLFGPSNQQTGQRDPSKSAVEKLYGSLILLIPEWPELLHPVATDSGVWRTHKADPDELTIEEVIDLLQTPPFYKAPHKRGA